MVLKDVKKLVAITEESSGLNLFYGTFLFINESYISKLKWFVEVALCKRSNAFLHVEFVFCWLF